MSIVLITGSGGLIGSEAVDFFANKFDVIVGIDNNMRKAFFGNNASTAWNVDRLIQAYDNYRHVDEDIRNEKAMEVLFSEYGPEIQLIIHTAAQPSHDWAGNDPFTDFTVNANGTLLFLEMTRRYCPEAVFIFTSTNKVYGDTPNQLPLIEREKRFELDASHRFFIRGIDESMNVDKSTHSLFGASKLSADLLVQEYGRYFGMKTVCFRAGCVTGPNHTGVKLHGFLSYLMRCAITGDPYTVIGYKAKQVRDNIHAYDLVNQFWHFYQTPRIAEIYNTGGSRHSHCSILEGISICEEITGKKMNWSYNNTNRVGDHIWWISDISRFQKDYPKWSYKYDLQDLMAQIYDRLTQHSH